MKDLERRVTQINHSSINDLVSTLTIFSASVIAQDLQNLYETKMIKPIELFKEYKSYTISNLTMFDNKFDPIE